MKNDNLLDGMGYPIDLFDMEHNPIYNGSQVEMPEPNDDDAWQFGGFVATVTDYVGGMLIVEDADGDFWSVEPKRVIVN